MDTELIAAGIGAGAGLFPLMAKNVGSAWKAVAKKVDYLRSGKRYDEKIVELYNEMRVFGQAKPRPLDDIFTDVYILPKPTLMRRFSLAHLEEAFLALPRDGSLRSGERVKADTLVGTEDKLFILGQPGAGKTTFCKHLAVREARGRGHVGKVPIFVTLKQYADTGLSLLDFINEQFDVCDFPDSAPFVAALLRGGKALVLFDGLDEVTKDGNGRNRVAAEIIAFSRKYNECHIVVTCRVAANDYSFEQFHYVEMAEFAPEQVATFVRQWFLGKEENVGKAEKMLADLANHEGISDLTRNPLLLTLLCLNYDETMSFPARRVEIYQDALEALLKKWDKSRGIQRGSAYGSLSVGRKQEMLAEIAYETYCEGRYFFKQRALAEQLADYVAGAPEVPAKIDIDGEVILQEIIAQHGVLAFRATDIVSFSHKTFHEYFTAKQIVENREAGTFAELLKHTAEDSWKEVFLLTASLLRRRTATQFFRLFVERLQGELGKHPRAMGWLAEVAAATDASESGYRPATTRAYFAHVLALALALAHDLAHAHALAHAHDLAHDLDLALDLDLDLALAFALAPAHALARAKTLGLEALAEALGQLKVPDGGASQDEWERFLQALQGVIDTHRPLDNLRKLQAEARQLSQATKQDKLTDGDIKVLNAFVRGSKRLYDCLQVAYLLPDERVGFEEGLLLPF